MAKHVIYLNFNKLFKKILLLSCFAGVIYILINIFTGYYYIAAVQTVLVAIYLWFYKKTKIDSNRDKTQTIAKLYLVILCASLLFVLAKENVPKSVYIWVLLIPFLSYLLLGRLWGAIYTAVFISLAGALYFYKFHAIEEMMNLGFVSNLISCTLITWLLAYEYELLSNRTQSGLIDIAAHDELTGLYNRSQLKYIFNQEIKNSDNNNEELSVIVLDIDWFKKINDTYGHICGDEVLRLVANLIKVSIREGDSAFRIGGEEFCVVLPSTSIKKAQEVAERIRMQVAEELYEYGTEKISITISCGVAESGHDKEKTLNLFKIADQRLYAAKDRGRNQVVAQ